MLRILLRELGIVIAIGATKALADYMSKQEPKKLIDLVATKVASENISAEVE